LGPKWPKSARCHFTGPKKLSISRAQPLPTCPSNGCCPHQKHYFKLLGETALVFLFKCLVFLPLFECLSMDGGTFIFGGGEGFLSLLHIDAIERAEEREPGLSCGCKKPASCQYYRTIRRHLEQGGYKKVSTFTPPSLPLPSPCPSPP
jgi:hypothetical protein